MTPGTLENREIIGIVRRHYGVKDQPSRRNSIRHRSLWRIIGHRSGGGDAHGVLRAWIAWERFSNWLWATEPVPGAPYGLLKVRLVHHRGQPIYLPDETVISSGDLIGELHCDNAAIAALIRGGKINRYAACRRDLQSLAHWLIETEEATPIKALYGVTMLWWAGARLGFSVRRRHRGLRDRLDRIFMAGLLLVYSTEGSNRANQGKTLDSYPREVWISRAELTKRYPFPASYSTSLANDQVHERG